jgi:hypothetical protein
VKKLLLVLSFLFAAVTCFSQGQVIFNNNTATKVSNVLTMAAAPTGTMVGIYIGASDSLETTLTLITTTNMFAPGLFAGNTRTLAGWGAGPVALQVRAWVAGYNSYEEAVAAQVIVGNSIVMNVTLDTPPWPPPTLVRNGLNQFNLGMDPIGTPEPSHLALALIGLATLVGFCRFK